MNTDVYTKSVEDLLIQFKCDLWYFRQTDTWRATWMGMKNKSGEGPTPRDAIIAFYKTLQ